MVKEGASVTAGESVMRIPMVISPPSCVNALSLSPSLFEKSDLFLLLNSLLL